MTEADIRELAAEVLLQIAPEADLKTLSDDEDMREALDLDSMDFLNFVIGLHKASGVDIPEVDYPKLFTMKGVVKYLARRPLLCGAQAHGEYGAFRDGTGRRAQSRRGDMLACRRVP
jgi:acyl carrier protein